MGAIIICLFVASFFFAVLFSIAKVGVLVWCGLVFFDTLLLYTKRKALVAGRLCKQRFNNGEENEVQLQFINNYNFEIDVRVVDEIPDIFQQQNWYRDLTLKSSENKFLQYSLQPFERGEFTFGNILAFVSSPFQIVQRKFTFPAQQIIQVYPSFSKLKQYKLFGTTNHLTEVGNKRLRKLGNSIEFEQIKDYVRGDDYRKINWKATARKNQLMVNTYVDEKSQQIYCVIDKSRNMKMPFDGLSLLDYAINASLILSNVALQKQDKVGLISFAEKMNTFLLAERYNVQMENILNSLYKEKTNFLDADYENLYSHVRQKIKHRSLLVLFTNFESKYALERQLPYLKKIAHHHLLLVVIFENTEIKKKLQEDAKNTEEIYIQVIAEKYDYEKRLIVKELQKHGILAILTTPENLTINAVNKYLEIKSRQAI